jgi:midasin (ATPase involved in ribosome maturation)
MTIEFDNDQLFISCSGSQFSEQVESCKVLGMRYNAEKRAWAISPGFLDDVMKEMQQYNLSISEYDKNKIKEYFDTMNELKKITKRSEWRKFHPELLNVEPLIQEQKDNGATNESN